VLSSKRVSNEKWTEMEGRSTQRKESGKKPPENGTLKGDKKQKEC